MLAKEEHYTVMADHLLHNPPSYDLKLWAQRHPSIRVLLKLQCVLHGFVSRHASRVAAALGGTRSVLLDLLSKKASVKLMISRKIKRRRKNNTDNRSSNSGPVTMQLSLLPPGAMLSSCLSSETAVLSLPDDDKLFCPCSYYDPSWNTVNPAELPLQLPVTGYLEWPADQQDQMEDDIEEEDAGCNEIDMLAERFIARCHERFMLEKQESCRRFQEMLARSL